jgi:hypothetical protein
MATSQVEINAILEGCDYWEVRVIRCGREFLACETNSEQKARESLTLWREQENVEEVGLFCDGNRVI